MRREGSALQGLGVVMLKELSDHLTSVRMRVLEWLVVLIALAALYGAIQQIKDTTAEDPFLFLRLFTTVARAAAVVRLVPVVPGAADGDRARLRCRQRRAQPAHAVAHPGAADLSRRAAVRQIPRRPGDAVDQPGRAVAAGHRARPARARHSARRRGNRARFRLPAGDDRLCRRVAGAGAVVLDPVPLGRDRGAGHARPLAVPDLHLAGAAPARSRKSSCLRIRATWRLDCRRPERWSWSRSWRGCRRRPCSARSWWRCSIRRPARSGRSI